MEQVFAEQAAYVDIFNNNMIVAFILFLTSILSYSEIKLQEQRIAIAYIVIFVLQAAGMISFKVAIVFILLTFVIYIEILTDDKMKLKIVTNIWYKTLDLIYQTVFMYHLIPAVFTVGLLELYNTNNFGNGFINLFILPAALVFGVYTINRVLSEEIEFITFNEIYSKIMEYPINKFVCNEKFCQASSILVAIEDKNFYQRKGYTVFSFRSTKNIVDRKFKEEGGSVSRIKIFAGMVKMFLYNMRTQRRGYSTIGSQLLRSLAIETGYDSKWKRKFFEAFYTNLFFKSLYNYLSRHKVANRQNYRQWLIYLYFHYVNTFLGDEDIRFSKFLNVFDMQYSKKNTIDIYDVSNEGILLACWGLSKKTKYITKNNLSGWIPDIPGVKFEYNLLSEMIEHLNEPFYDGQYLK